MLKTEKSHIYEIMNLEVIQKCVRQEPSLVDAQMELKDFFYEIRHLKESVIQP
jgi:hypothetical protein